MKDSGQMMKILMIAAGAYGIYWYLQNYGPNGWVASATLLAGGPGSYWNTYFGAATTTTTTTAATGTATATGVPAATTAQAALVPQVVYGVTLKNTTRGGNSLQVGDSWQVTVLGPPNSSVVGAAQQNGNSLGSTGYGSTDSTGKLILNGTADPTTVGSWTEQWSVGGTPVGSISFTVTAASGVSGMGAIVPTSGVPGNAPSRPASPTGGWSSLASLTTGSSYVH